MSDNNSPQVPSRRRFIGVAAAAVAAGSLSQLAFAETNQAITEVSPPAGGTRPPFVPFACMCPNRS